MSGDYLIDTVPEDVSGSEIGWDTTDVIPAAPGWFLRNGFFRTPFYHHYPALEWCWYRHRQGPQDLPATGRHFDRKVVLRYRQEVNTPWLLLKARLKVPSISLEELESKWLLQHQERDKRL